MAQLTVKVIECQKLRYLCFDRCAQQCSFYSLFCEKIKRKLTASRGRRRRALNATPAQRKRDWYRRQIARVRPADMIEDTLTYRGLAKIFNNQ